MDLIIGYLNNISGGKMKGLTKCLIVLGVSLAHPESTFAQAKPPAPPAPLAFEVSVNDADYQTVNKIDLDLGIGQASENFDIDRYFMIQVRNASAHPIQVKESSKGTDKGFWIKGAGNGTFTLRQKEVRTISIRAKCSTECQTEAKTFAGSINWQADGKTVLEFSLKAAFGPSTKTTSQNLPKLEACCDQTWERKDVPIPYPTLFHYSGGSSPNNWGPSHADRAAGWRETTIRDVPASNQVIVHYGIQSADDRWVADKIVNKRSLTPTINIVWTLGVKSISYALSPEVKSRMYTLAANGVVSNTTDAIALVDINETGQ